MDLLLGRIVGRHLETPEIK